MQLKNLAKKHLNVKIGMNHGIRIISLGILLPITLLLVPSFSTMPGSYTGICLGYGTMAGFSHLIEAPSLMQIKSTLNVGT